MSRPVQILGLILATALLSVCSTAAASVRLGPDLTPVQDGLGYGCQTGSLSPCSYVNLRSTGAVPVAAPFSGVITKWRFRAAAASTPRPSRGPSL